MSELEYMERYKPAQLRISPVLSQCYLCGSTEKLEVEHVIPKTLFKPHVNKHPITLRACHDCNHAKSLDDEYNVKSLQLTSFTDKAGDGLKDSAQRLAKKQGKILLPRTPGLGLYKDIESRIKTKNVVTPGGVALGQHRALHINVERYELWLIALAKGLMTYNTQLIHDWSKYMVRLDYNQVAQSTELYNGEVSSDLWNNGEFGQLWKDVFTYRGSITPEKDASMWGMIFYNSHIAIVGFGDKVVAEKRGIKENPKI